MPYVCRYPRPPAHSPRACRLPFDALLGQFELCGYPAQPQLHFYGTEPH